MKKIAQIYVQANPESIYDQKVKALNCKICNENANETALLCDICDKAFHIGCVHLN